MVIRVFRNFSKFTWFFHEPNPSSLLLYLDRFNVLYSRFSCNDSITYQKSERKETLTVENSEQQTKPEIVKKYEPERGRNCDPVPVIFGEEPSRSDYRLSKCDAVYDLKSFHETILTDR